MIWHYQRRQRQVLSLSLSLLILCTIIIFVVVFIQTTNGVQLTVDNFEYLTKGKSVFIKFYAPWCGHCRSMADDWSKLEEEWLDHPVGLIGDVDCTSEQGEPLCSDFDVQGFPTLVYGDPLAAETYDGERDYQSLSEFAKQHISKPICSIHHIDVCTDDEKQIIINLQSKTNEELEQIAQQVTDQVQDEERQFDSNVADIQKQYDILVDEFNKKIENIKIKYNYKYVEQVMTTRMAAKAAEEEASATDNEDDNGEL